ncbi:lantibiotic dehydratase [Glycomyces tenuis]|uniref:lantibiotic dehydratase n=1 Tax=Glycomyces tenuis TaxID=58116 RepID=UPI0003FBB580|nr:lantibiotic dehydratase [Glycomyces tenuis]
MYRIAGPGQLRATTCFAAAVPDPPVELADVDAASTERARAWIVAVWADEEVAAAIEIASPVLARRIEAISSGKGGNARQIRRAAAALLRYRLRMTTRATPFGLFAGIAPISIGQKLTVHHDPAYRIAARPDAVWLGAVVDRLESDPELLRHLHVVANNLAFVTSGRLVLTTAASSRDSSGPIQVSIRYTEAVATVMRIAGDPIAYSDLAAKLGAEFPDTAPEVIESMLRSLVAQRLLLTSLRPPMTDTDPLGRVIAELVTIDRGPGEHTVADLPALRRAHRALAEAERTTGGKERRTALTRAAEQMRAITDRAEQPIAVDVRIADRVELPRRVIAEAEHAATLLRRLTRYPGGFPSWIDYHHQFLERYGLGACIRVRDLVDPGSGLGFPAGYRDSLLSGPSQALTDRDRSLMALAQRATADGCTTIDLDDRTLRDLAAEPADTSGVPPHAEISFHLRAADPTAIDGGRFALVIERAGRAAGTITGRFLHMLDGPEHEEIARAMSGLPTTTAEAALVQLSGPPLYTRTANVGRVPVLLARTFALGEYPAGRLLYLDIDDLAVTADLSGLRLVSLQDGRVIEPLVPNAIEQTTRLHPLQRFLSELPRARAAVYAPFDWGAAAALPFVPRIRSGRSIISIARWTITTDRLPGRDSSWPEWSDAWDRVRQRYRIPSIVFLGESNIRHRVDLENTAHLRLVRSELDRSGIAILREAPTDTDLGWIDGRAHEITLPLAANEPPIAITQSPPPALTDPTPEHLPGHGAWLSAKLYGHPDRLTHLLADRLPRLFDDWPDEPAWWYLRYRDPRPHLRLRIRLSETTGYGNAAEHLGNWAAELRRCHLISDLQLDTYRPETGRFGPGPTMASAEDFFIADSAAARAQLRHLAARKADSQVALCAASLIDLCIGFTGSVDEGMRWLNDHVDRHGPPLDRALTGELARLLDAEADRGSLASYPTGTAVLDSWRRRGNALTAYRIQLFGTDRPNVDSTLASVLHLHHARFIDVDKQQEETVLRVARAAAQTWTARTRRSPR